MVGHLDRISDISKLIASDWHHSIYSLAKEGDKNWEAKILRDYHAVDVINGEPPVLVRIFHSWWKSRHDVGITPVTVFSVNKGYPIQSKITTISCDYCQLVWYFMLSIFRLLLAGLHYNENGDKDQAVTRAGCKRYSVFFPKFKKGRYSVRPITKKSTFSK